MLANTSPPPTLARLTTLKFSPLPPTRHQTSPLSSFPSSLNTRPLPLSSRHSFARRHSSLPRYCSLGAETHGGITAKLITRNVAISAKKSQTFRLPLMVKPPSESGSSRESVVEFGCLKVVNQMSYLTVGSLENTSRLVDVSLNWTINSTG